MSNEMNDTENGIYNRPKKARIVVEKTPPDCDGNTCDCLKEGQVFEFDFERCPADFCAAAFHSLWPSLRVLELGGRHPWDAQPNVTRITCPDPTKPVVLRIEVE